MAASERSTRCRPRAHALDLPPPFRLVALREAADAFAHAKRHAAELGAGTLVFVGRFDLAEFAVVLEPEEPLAPCRRIFYAGMAALCDALAGAAPPEKPIVVDWPDAIRVDGGLVGGGRLVWPPDAEERAVPDWLVFGATVRTVFAASTEPGLHALATTLEDEGFGDFGSERLVESFARHLMVAVDRWREGEHALIAAAYLERLKPESGARHRIAENGDLVIFRGGKPAETRTLSPALVQPSWLDAATGEPRL